MLMALLNKKTYDAFNRLATITDARGVVKTHTYDVARRLLLSESYSDETNNRTYLYNFLAMPEQISDDAGVRNLVYNSFNELEIREGCKPSYKDHPCLWLITWDPTQPVATRPLAIQKGGTWYAYGWDLTKNICEIFGQNGYIRSTYAYTPFGSVTANGDVTQPIQWSSEYYDSELALVYYNYRHYNPTDGRWINCDPIAEQGGWNLYGFEFADYLGLTGDYKPALFDDLEGAQKALKNVAVPALIRKLNERVNEEINKLYKKIDAGENITGKRIDTRNTFEIGGWVFRTKINNKYIYDINVQDGDFEEFKLDKENITLPKQGYCRVAIWHAHPIGLVSESIKKIKTDQRDEIGRPVKIYEVVNSRIKGLIDDDSITNNDKRAAFGFAFKREGKIIKVVQKSTKTANPFKLPSFILTGKEYSYKTVYRIPLVKNIDLNNYFSVNDFDLYLLSRIHEKPIHHSQAILRIYKNGIYHGRKSIINVPLD